MAAAVPHLLRRVEFLRVAGSGRKWVAPGLILQVRRRKPGEVRPGEAVGGEDPPMRVGFTVSRKVGNAVVRNRVRRRLRAVAEKVLPLRARSGQDYVLIGRASSVGRPFCALLEDLETALVKLGACRDEAPALKRGEG